MAEPNPKPVYLLYGDDLVRLDEWRARVRCRAELGDGSTLEVLEGDRATGDALVEALSAMTLAVGGRFILVDGIQRWKDADVKRVAAALAQLPPETFVVLISEPDRKKKKDASPPKALVKAVERCGGEVRQLDAPTRANYAKWVRERAQDVGLRLDLDAAEVLVSRIGEDDGRPPRLRQRRILRELEKLAIYASPDAELSASEVEKVSSTAVESRSWQLADAVVEGDGARAQAIAEELLARGEEMMYIVFALYRRLKEMRGAQLLVAQGRAGEIDKRPWVAKQIAAQAKRADPDRLERAIELLADVDWAVRGGAAIDATNALTRMLAELTAGEHVLARA
jgi:DNA polymerase III subunit delta